MSTATTTSPATTEPADAHVHEHPSDWQYVKIALFLAVLTGLEVGTYFWKDIFGSTPSTGQLLLVLMPMMAIKFVTVCAYFMHLKYDNPLFKRVFMFGLLLAMVVYAIFLFTMEFWTDDYLKFLR
jgi:cytochrome c oxidase subunit 4